jgi:hypothetical protein
VRGRRCDGPCDGRHLQVCCEGGQRGDDHRACLESITNFGAAGPFRYTQRTSGKVKFWVPQVPAGCKVPVVHLANGTTANCGNYEGALQRLATHGFLAACYEDPNTGAGEYGIIAFDTAMREFPDLVDNKLGSTGHSQGGQASMVTLQLAEQEYGSSYTYAGLAMQPASGFGTQPRGQSWAQSYSKIRSPVFMYSGSFSTGFANSTLLGLGVGDGLVAISWVDQGYNALSRGIEAYHWTAVGASHIPTPQVEQNQVQIAWFRWKLLGDKRACEYFKTLPQNGWKVQKQQNVAPCN